MRDNKRGVSTIVASILMILLTVGGVTIIWSVIVPMIKENIELSDISSNLIITNTAGYTYFDETKEVFCVQIKNDGIEEEKFLSRAEIIFTFSGNAEKGFFEKSELPLPNNLKSKCFDLTGKGKPDSVAVAPVFSSGGKTKRGSITSKIEGGKIKKGTCPGACSNLACIGPSCIPPSLRGEPCPVPNCVVGLLCNGALCYDPSLSLSNTEACYHNSECASLFCNGGFCDAAPLPRGGSPCAVGLDCITNKCNLANQFCFNSSLNLAKYIPICYDDSECQSNYCDIGGLDRCINATQENRGGACGINEECTTAECSIGTNDICFNSTLDQGVGATCYDISECQAGLSCDVGGTFQCTAAPQPRGSPCTANAQCDTNKCSIGINDICYDSTWDLPNNGTICYDDLECQASLTCNIGVECVAPPFNPASIPGLRLWLNAEDIPTFIPGVVNGQNIFSWNDSSGNGNDLAQSSGSKQPEYRTNQINSLPAVYFNGTGLNSQRDLMFVNGPTILQPFYIFIVYRPIASTSGTDRLISDSNDIRAIFRSTSTNSIFDGSGSTIQSPVNWGNWNLNTLHANVASSYNLAHPANLNLGGGLATSNFTLMVLNSRTTSGSNWFDQADYAEILVYEGALTNTQVNDINNYLGTRYGLPIYTF